jgi:ketosteroid isomerase-like protein
MRKTAALASVLILTEQACHDEMEMGSPLAEFELDRRLVMVGPKITRRHALAATASMGFFEVAKAERAQTDIPDDLRKTMEEYHRAEVAFQKGDPQPFKDICSHADDVTIVGGMGGVEKGWANVEKRYEWAASRFSTDNSEPQSEIVSLVATPDMAYAVEIERSAARMAGSSELQQLALRVTTVFRREGGQWKVVHRHADPLMSVKQYGR